MERYSLEALEGESYIVTLLRDIFWTETPRNLLQQLGVVEFVEAQNDLDRALNNLFSVVKNNQEHLETFTENLEVEFARLFIGPQRPPAIPYASYYLFESKTLMSEATIEVRKRYLGSFMAVKDLFSTPEDHIAIELEYLVHLTIQASDAVQRGEIDRMESLLIEKNSFIAMHMTPWIHKFVQNITEATQEPFYRAAADLLSAYIKLAPIHNDVLVK